LKQNNQPLVTTAATINRGQQKSSGNWRQQTKGAIANKATRSGAARSSDGRVCHNAVSSDSDCNSQKIFLEQSNQLAPTTAAAATKQNKAIGVDNNSSSNLQQP